MSTLLRLDAAMLPRNVVIGPPMSDADFEKFCLENQNVRIERAGDGVIHMNAPAGGFTGDGNAEIVYQLRGWWHTHHEGRVFDSSTGFYLSDSSMLSPDSAYVRPETLAGLSRHQLISFPRLAPDFVIELLSYTDDVAQSHAKMRQWIINGVGLAWLIDPYQKKVFIYQPGSEMYSSSELLLRGSGPVEGFTLDLAKVWSCYEV